MSRNIELEGGASSSSILREFNTSSNAISMGAQGRGVSSILKSTGFYGKGWQLQFNNAKFLRILNVLFNTSSESVTQSLWESVGEQD